MWKIYDPIIYWTTEIDQFRRHDVCKYLNIRKWTPCFLVLKICHCKTDLCFCWNLVKKIINDQISAVIVLLHNGQFKYFNKLTFEGIVWHWWQVPFLCKIIIIYLSSTKNDPEFSCLRNNAKINRIGGVIDNVLVSSVVNRGFKFQSSQT